MAKLDDLAAKKLLEHKLPDMFSYRQAFIIGYNARRNLEAEKLFGLPKVSIGDMNNNPPEEVES